MQAGAHEAVIGMAHRGRLNVLAHIVGVTYEAILAEFEAGRGGRGAQKGGSDDVKYHLGAEGTFRTPDGTELSVTLSPNPSHLEAVNPVVEGRARAPAGDRRTPVLAVDRHRTLPILIMATRPSPRRAWWRVFSMARLAGTGGTIHDFIANNQIGFTTGPTEGRSATYSSDLAEGFDAPIIHVNADDPEATLAAARLAMMYRQRFHADVVIDLVGYRRYGRNEGDDPACPTACMPRSRSTHIGARGVRQGPGQGRRHQQKKADAGAQTAARDLAERQATVRKQHAEPQLDRGPDSVRTEDPGEPETAVDAATLQRLNQQLYRWPATFHINTKLAKQWRSAGQRLASRTAASSGRTPRPWPLPRCWSRASRSASPARTPCAAHSASNTRPCGTPRRAPPSRPSSTWRCQGGVRAAQQPAERIRDRRLRVRLRGHRARGAGAVGGAVRRLRQAGPRSSSTSSSSPALPSGGRLRA